MENVDLFPYMPLSKLFTKNITQLIGTHMVFWEKVSSKIQFMLLGFPFKLSIIPFNALGKVIHKVGLS
jgi:hypothetical protein